VQDDAVGRCSELTGALLPPVVIVYGDEHTERTVMNIMDADSRAATLSCHDGDHDVSSLTVSPLIHCNLLSSTGCQTQRQTRH
jgi:hypothetical protein